MTTNWDAERIDRTQLIMKRVMGPIEHKGMSMFFQDVDSTREERDRLRQALATSSADPELIADLRYFFNFLRETGEVIPWPQVRAASRIARGEA